MIKTKPPPYFTADKIKRLQVILGESDKKTLKIANFFRVEGRKKCVEPGLSQSLSERNSRLNPHFKGVMIKQTVIKKVQPEVCSDFKIKIK